MAKNISSFTEKSGENSESSKVIAGMEELLVTLIN